MRASFNASFLGKQVSRTLSSRGPETGYFWLLVLYSCRYSFKEGIYVFNFYISIYTFS